MESHSVPQPMEGQATYEYLRSNALGYRLGADADSITPQREVHGVIVDWGLGDGMIMTIVCMNDGAASIYLNNGAGFIGGGTHTSVQEVSKAVLAEAVRTQHHLHENVKVALPAAGKMRFTVIKDAGLFTTEQDVSAISQGPFMGLCNQVMALVAAIRTATPG